MLGNREECFYYKFLAAYEIPTLVGLISIEFPWANIVVRIGDCMKCFLWLKRYSARRAVSVVQREYFLLEWPLFYFINWGNLIGIRVFFEIVHRLVLMVFVFEFKLLHAVSHLTEPPHQTLRRIQIFYVSWNAWRIWDICRQTVIFVNVVEKIWIDEMAQRASLNSRFQIYEKCSIIGITTVESSLKSRNQFLYFFLSRFFHIYKSWCHKVVCAHYLFL